MKEILEQAIRVVKGEVSGEFSKAQENEGMRNALIELNGGSTKISPKTFHRGTQLFALVEELIPTIIDEGLKDSDAIFQLVEYRNIAAGDEAEFYTEGEATFVVADIASGIRGIRRQRLSGGEKITVPTVFKGVRVYETLGRLLAGRITFDAFVSGVAKSFNQKILADAYAALSSITQDTAGLTDDYVYAGTYDEGKLIEMVEHVEAATGSVARIYGTKAALRKVTTAVTGDMTQTDMYNLGYYGKFNGTEMIALRQAHKPGTNEFVLNDSQVFVVAGDDKPVKVVNEGEGLMIDRDPTENNDLTQEYFYGQAVGVGVICANKMAVYTFSD